MLDDNALVVAFRTRLLTVAGLPPEDMRAWENVTFDPSPDATWVKEHLAIDDEDLTSFGTLEATGRMIYTFFEPLDRGAEGVRVLARAAALAFEPGQSLQNGDLDVILEKTQRGAGRRASPASEDFGDEEGALWYAIPVQVFWRTFTPSTS